jgi:hypothetical protein
MMMVSANAGALTMAARVRGMSKSARTARDMRAMAVILRTATFEDEGAYRLNAAAWKILR